MQLVLLQKRMIAKKHENELTTLVSYSSGIFGRRGAAQERTTSWQAATAGDGRKAAVGPEQPARQEGVA